jgi:hypothetical protein
MKLAAVGLTVEPTEVAGLPPQEEIALQVTLNTNVALTHEYPLGGVEQLLVLQLQQGPRVGVLLSATVCLPTLALSLNTYDFGEVLVGEVRHVVGGWRTPEAERSRAGCPGLVVSVALFDHFASRPL